MGEQEFTWKPDRLSDDGHRCTWNQYSLWAFPATDTEYFECWEWNVINDAVDREIASGRSRGVDSAKCWAERFAELAFEASLSHYPTQTIGG